VNNGIFAPPTGVPYPMRLNRRTFVSTGTFTVPANVAWVTATVVAGGGGGTDDVSNGGAGGTSSFGSFISCTGGAGGVAASPPTAASNGVATFANSVVNPRSNNANATPTNAAGGIFISGISPAGGSAGASPFSSGFVLLAGAPATRAGQGGFGAGLVPVTPGQSITVTIGAAGSTNNGNPGSGAVQVEWIE